MINIPDPVSALLNRLSRYKAASPPENTGCEEEGEPVDVVTGANLEESIDFPLCAELNLSWRRYYDSSQRGVRGPLGWGWRHEFEATLRFDVDGILYVSGKGSPVGFPDLVKDRACTARSGFVLRRATMTTYQLERVGEPTWEFSIAANMGVGRLTRIFNKIGYVRFAYDNEHRITRIDRSANPSVGLEYDSRGLLIGVVEQDERVAPKPFVSYEYDRNENLVTWTDAFGGRATLEYDDQHRLIRKGDRRGYSYHYSYDDQSRCIHTWGEDGMYDVRFTYLEEMRCTKATHADGGIWMFLYDENGTITRILDPYGKARDRKVNSAGKVISEIDAAGNEYRIVYDRSGGIAGRRDPFGHVSSDLRDLRRRNYLALTAPTNPVGYEHGTLVPREVPIFPSQSAFATPGIVRDRLGRKIEQRLGEHVRRRWSYDANGNVLELVDGDGSASRFEYASWNLLHREIDPLGNATEYAYTKRERITKVVDPGGTTSEYAYDLRDNILRVTRNGNVREEYVRDEADNLTEKRDGSGRTILRFEIGPGNLKSVRRLASGENHYFEYDDSARMTRAATDAHETLFEYRFGRRPISDLRDGRGVRHEFERLGRAHIVTLNRFETRYARVGGGLL
jgi:YD repeat-containing protein